MALIRRLLGKQAPAKARLSCMGAPTAELGEAAIQLLRELESFRSLNSPCRLIWRNYRVAAGKAYLQENSIGLSRALITDEVRLKDTLIHEYAHLLAFSRSPQRGAGHGPLWRQTMAELGAKPEVRHRYEVKHNQSRSAVRYQCTKCQQTFVRRRKLPKHRKFVHANCGGGLRLIRSDTTATRNTGP